MFAALALVLHLARADHLVPKAGALFEDDDYERAVRRVLLVDRSREIQMVTLPSGGPEEAVYVLRPRDGAPVVVALRARRQIHAEAQRPFIEEARRIGRASQSAEARAASLAAVKVEVERVEAPIGEETVKQLDELWNAALLQVRYPTERSSGLDGTRYHFADWTMGSGTRAGTTWSPPPGSLMRGLVGVGEALAALARAPAGDRPAGERALQALVQRLLPRLAPRR
jgi:hypothetical protein